MKPSFDEVFNKYKQRIFSLIYRLIPETTEAEDLTQEVFLRAFKAYEKFREEAEIYSWLYRITLNLCKEVLRKKMRLKKHVKEITSLNHEFTNDEGKKKPAEFQDISSTLPLEILEKEEKRKTIREAIDSLPSKYKDVIILCDIEEMSYEEVAKILKISVDAVGVRLYRARNILKIKLKKFL